MRTITQKKKKGTSSWGGGEGNAQRRGQAEKSRTDVEGGRGQLQGSTERVVRISELRRLSNDILTISLKRETWKDSNFSKSSIRTRKGGIGKGLSPGCESSGMRPK